MFYAINSILFRVSAGNEKTVEIIKDLDYNIRNIETKAFRLIPGRLIFLRKGHNGNVGSDSVPSERRQVL